MIFSNNFRSEILFFFFGLLVVWVAVVDFTLIFNLNCLFVLISMCVYECVCVAFAYIIEQSDYNVLHISDALVSFNLLTFHSSISRITRFSHVAILILLKRELICSCAFGVSLSLYSRISRVERNNSNYLSK